MVSRKLNNSHSLRHRSVTYASCACLQREHCGHDAGACCQHKTFRSLSLALFLPRARSLAGDLAILTPVPLAHVLADAGAPAVLTLAPPAVVLTSLHHGETSFHEFVQKSNDTNRAGFVRHVRVHAAGESSLNSRPSDSACTVKTLGFH